MLFLPTAKVLLYIALNLGPHDPAMVYATSNSESYVWEQTSTGGWTLEAKGFPASDCTRDPSKSMTFNGTPDDSIPPYLRSVSQYHWHNHNAMVFDNGTRVEKRGDHAFYIINAGGANEKIFTIFYTEKKKS